MINNRVVTEIDLQAGYKHRRYIKFDLDDGKGFCYRSRMTHNAFFHNYKTKRNQTDQYLYHAKSEAEHQMTIDVWAESMAENTNLPDIYSSVPVVTVKNVWEFYKLIGYDYKTKKWI
jgi:hypothetical protein